MKELGYIYFICKNKKIFRDYKEDLTKLIRKTNTEFRRATAK